MFPTSAAAWVTPRCPVARHANANGDRGTSVCVRMSWLKLSLLDCADELKPWPAVSEGISPLNDTKLQGSTSAQHIHCCLCCLNWIVFKWMAAKKERTYCLNCWNTTHFYEFKYKRKNGIILSTKSTFLIINTISNSILILNLDISKGIETVSQKITRVIQWMSPRSHNVSPSITNHLCCTPLSQTTFTNRTFVHWRLKW